MPIAATVDRFEGQQAVVHLDDGQELVLSKTELPPEAAEGARLMLNLTHESQDEAKRAEAARQLLTDLLRRKN